MQSRSPDKFTREQSSGHCVYFVGSSRRFVAAMCEMRFGQSLEVDEH